MKITASLLLAFVAGTHATSPLRKSDRSLQNNYNGYQQDANNQNYWGEQGGNQGQGNYNGYMNAQGQQYENFEQYMNALIASRSFSFTGCSTIDTQYYGSQTYVTYRFCDSCSSRRSNGCDDSNGDYVVHMREFAETYREYLKETTGQENSMFECVK